MPLLYPVDPALKAKMLTYWRRRALAAFRHRHQGPQFRSLCRHALYWWRDWRRYEGCR